MNLLASKRGAMLLGLLLTACATSAPAVYEEDLEAPDVVHAWEEARADPSCVVPLCDVERCALWRCQDVTEVDEHPVLLAQAIGQLAIRGRAHEPVRSQRPARALLLRLRREAGNPRMNYFIVDKDKASDYTGDVDGSNKWGLPGVICPLCKATWGGGYTYPSVDLTPVAALADFEEPRAEPIEEYERLCELVRPLLPPRAVLGPGTQLGPFVGRGMGRFGPFVMPVPWILMVQRETLEKLQAEGVRGLKGCRTELRFRQRASPELLDLELLPVARLHPDCLPPRPPPCPRCGRDAVSLPKVRLLDAATAPSDLDVFQLENFSGVIACTERFVDACQRLGLDGLAFEPLPVSPLKRGESPRFRGGSPRAR